MPFTYLRISVTDQCQLRCTYCRPIGYRPPPAHTLLTAGEITRLTTALTHQGVTKVRLTGGEPLLREDLIRS